MEACMRLILYEWFKLVSKRSVWLLLILCLIGNGAFYYNEQVSSHQVIIDNQAAYKQLIAEYSALQPNAAITKLEATIQDLYQERDQIYTELIEVNEQAERLSSIQSQVKLYSQVKEQLISIYGHEQFRAEVASKAETMLSVSIFQQQDSFSYRNITQTAQAFASQKDVTLRAGINEPIQEILEQQFNDYIILFFMLIFGFYIFHHEREGSQYLLIRSTRYGKLRTIGSKLTVYFGSISAVFVLVYGSCLIINYFLYGLDDMTRSIQSIKELARGQYVLSMSQFMTFFLLLKWLFFMFVAAIMALLFIMIQHLGKLIITVGTIIIIEYLSYLFVHPYSPFGVLKYVNIFYMLQADQMLTYYQNINVFGFPIPTLELNLYVLLAGIVISFVAGAVLFCSKYGDVDESSGWLTAITALKNKLIRPTTSHSLFSHESFKLMLSNKGYLILICAILFSYFNIQKEPVTLDDMDKVYVQYVEQYGGVLDEQKMQQLEAERDRFNHISTQLRQLEESLQNKTITIDEYANQIVPLQQQVYYISGFYKLYGQALELQQLQEQTGKSIMLTNAMANKYMFEHTLRSSLTAIFLMIFMILIVSSIVTTDFRANLHLLQQSSIYGRLRLWYNKHFVSYAIVTLLFVVVQLPPYLNLINYYTGFYWNAPIQSIAIYKQVSWPINVWQFLLLSSLAQLLAAFVIIEIILLLSYLLKKQALVIGSSTAIFLFPLITGSFYMEQFQGYPINRAFLLPLYLHSYEHSLLHMMLLLCIGGACAVLSSIWIRSSNRLRRRVKRGASHSSAV